MKQLSYQLSALPSLCPSLLVHAALCLCRPACLRVQLWDLRSNALLQHYGGSSSSITSAAWHPSGNFLLTSSLDTTLKVSVTAHTVLLKPDCGFAHLIHCGFAHLIRPAGLPYTCRLCSSMSQAV
jgi:hypothetical protein